VLDVTLDVTVPSVLDGRLDIAGSGSESGHSASSRVHRLVRE
jgi:hypothetical protein